MGGGSGKHKSGPERSLVMVRSQISAALDCLDDPERVKELLEGAEKALRSAEVKIRDHRRDSLMISPGHNTS